MHHPSCFPHRRPRLRARCRACCALMDRQPDLLPRFAVYAIKLGPYPGGYGGRCVGSGDRHWPVWRCCSPWARNPYQRPRSPSGAPVPWWRPSGPPTPIRPEAGVRRAVEPTPSCCPQETQILTTVNNSTYGPTGLPVIRSVITITGQGSTIARHSEAPQFRLFAVNSTGALTLNETTVSGGYALPVAFPGRQRRRGGELRRDPTCQ